MRTVAGAVGMELEQGDYLRGSKDGIVSLMIGKGCLGNGNYKEKHQWNISWVTDITESGCSVCELCGENNNNDHLMVHHKVCKFFNGRFSYMPGSGSIEKWRLCSVRCALRFRDKNRITGDRVECTLWGADSRRSGSTELQREPFYQGGSPGLGRRR